MPLRDRLYFRFCLFHKRYGRMVCAFLEGLIVGAILLACLLVLAGFVRITFAIIEDYSAQEWKARQERAERVRYEQIVLGCLNHGVLLIDGKVREC